MFGHGHPAIDALSNTMTGRDDFSGAYPNARFSMAMGVVQSVDNAASTCTIVLAGDTVQITAVPWLQPYLPAVNDTVLVFEQGSFRIIAGAFSTGTSNAGVTNLAVVGGGFNNFTPAANTAFQTIGTTTLMASPNLNVNTGVMAFIAGDGECADAAQVCQLKLGISLDGGATFGYGRALKGMVGSGSFGISAEDLPFTATCSLNGTPTGSIQLQAQWAVGGGTEAHFIFANIDFRAVIVPSAL